jgi:hypothetical protein
VGEGNTSYVILESAGRRLAVLWAELIGGQFILHVERHSREPMRMALELALTGLGT